MRQRDSQGSERLLLPGFVNAHTHSTEHWARGLIKPLPLELWVQQLIRHEPRGDAGWHGTRRWLLRGGPRSVVTFDLKYIAKAPMRIRCEYIFLDVTVTLEEFRRA